MANSSLSKRSTANNSRGRNSRLATTTRMAPSVACGRLSGSAVATRTTMKTTVAATRPVTCVRPPDAGVTSVRGGLALTANAPHRPATALLAPMTTRSRSRSSAGAEGAARRSTTAVCTTHTNATVSAGAIR